jgi:hypothetical protein
MRHNNYCFFVILLAVLSSLPLCTGCSDSNDESIGDNGLRFVYYCRPAEEVISNMGDYDPNRCESDLHITVTSKLKYDSTYNSLQRYTIAGDASIERELSKWINPKGEYTGDVPVIVEYRTEPCTSVRISLYDVDSTFVSDVTDEARFQTNFEWPYNYNNLLINEAKEVMGVIKDGMTIKEYLDNKPIIFSEAYFRFENLDRNLLSKGGFYITEITLSNGTVLISRSSNSDNG